MSETTKKIRSQPPDVIVAVGEGDALREFECYKVVLSFASPYFDAMFSADMHESRTCRVEYPDRDPEEWKTFYQFLTHDPSVDLERHAAILAPMFHEFQMDKHLSDCDELLATKVASLAKRDQAADDAAGCNYSVSYWDRRSNPGGRSKERKDAFVEIIELLELACTRDLPKTKEEANGFISSAAGTLLPGTLDLFDLPAITTLTELFLPLEKDEDGVLVPQGESDALWWALDEGFRQDEMCEFSTETINNNKMLPLLIKERIQNLGVLDTVVKISEGINTMNTLAETIRSRI